VILTDGGVYDNLGLETAWKRYTTVLVSDGGGKLGAEESIGRDYARQTLRVLNVIDNQVRSLRKRQLIASYEADAGDPDHRRGAYWGIRTDIAGYRLPDALPCPVGQTTKLANISTRLAKLGNTEQERLINWGFAVCDAALRTYVDTSLPRPDDFPYPGAKVG
jgi:NTE family protein